VDELSQRETFFDEVLKEGNIPSDLFPPKLRKWIEEAVERAVKLNYDDSEIENVSKKQIFYILTSNVG